MDNPNLKFSEKLNELRIRDIESFHENTKTSLLLVLHMVSNKIEIFIERSVDVRTFKDFCASAIVM